MATGKTWKLLGLAGLAGVAATGAVVVRAERRRRTVTPEDVRARLHARHAELDPTQHAAAESSPAVGAPPELPPWRSAWRRLLRRR